jgi:energy-converting hydrogenase Eha subunit G
MMEGGNEMGRLTPWAAGFALAATLAIVYTLCTATFALWPSATLEFFNAWFHGVDLRVLQPATSAFMPGIFLYGLSGIVLTGFVTGAIYAVMYSLIRRCPGCR